MSEQVDVPEHKISPFTVINVDCTSELSYPIQDISIELPYTADRCQVPSTYQF